MRLTIPGKVLIAALRENLLVVGKGDLSDAFKSVSIAAIKSTLRLASKSLSTTIVNHVKADITDGGTVTVPAELFYKLISKFGDADVTLELLPNQFLRVKQGGSVYGIPTMPNAGLNFQIPKEKGDAFDPKAFQDLIARAMYAAQKEEGEWRSTIRFEPGPEHVYAVGSDGKRLSAVQVPGKLPIPFQLTYSTCVALVKLLNGAASFSIVPLGGCMYAFIDYKVVKMNLAVAAFPEWRSIIPRGPCKSLIVNKDLFLGCLSRMQLTADWARIHIKDNIVMMANNGDAGTGNEALEAEEGSTVLDATEFGIGISLLAEAIAHVPGPKAEIEVRTAADPLRIKGDPNHIQLVCTRAV